MIQAKVVADSKNEFGNRLTTMVVTFPRIILAEMNTHRMMSRNSASSRAIPFEKMLKSVLENPFIPIAWQKDHSGMQGTEYLTGHDADVCTAMWLEARNSAVEAAQDLSDNGTTKQLCNRLLEPFMWHTVIITASEFENFFYLRCPKYASVDTAGKNVNKTFRSRKDWKAAHPGAIVDSWGEIEWLQCNTGQAEIHMMALAEAMWDAFNESTPKPLLSGEWHIPFGDNIPPDKLIPFLESKEIPANKDKIEQALVEIATARCARVSYTVVGEEGKPDNYENDLKLHDRLAASGHWSPFEHCAKAMGEIDFDDEFGSRGWSGNFQGFVQYRKTFNNENVTN